MTRLPLPCLAALCLSVTFVCTASAQPAATAAQPNAPKTGVPAKDTATGKTSKDPEAERIIRERRAQAQSLLISLAADAGNYNDQKLRARTQARIADALWEADPERSRALFRKAWDAAEIVDREGRQRMQDEIKQQQAKRGNAAVTGPPNVRGEVLRLAARRDRALGEELLAKLKIDQQQQATEASDKTRSNLFETPEAISQRLSLARQLLETDVERSLQFADAALATITREGIDYLTYLREKDPTAADRRYASLLGRAAGSMQSDANTVSMLSSYLFTPHVFVAYSSGGASTSQTGRSSPPPETTPELRAAFFRTAADILQRPLAPPGQDQSSSGVEGKYMVLKRMMPLFEQYASKEITELVRAQMEALTPLVSEGVRDRDDETMREGIRPQQKSEDREKTLLDQVERAKTSAERDALYLTLARLVGENGELRARDYIDKIDDADLRKNARAFIDAQLIFRAVDKKDAETILELVRTGELTHLQKTWALTQAARVLTKTDREKALSVIDDALTEARRIDGSDPDRPKALMAVANALLLSDRDKTWDAVYDAVKAANSAEGFTGEDGVLRIMLTTKSMASIRTSSAPDFDVNGVFRELARADYSRTVELARGFEREAPRASATIAIARAVLEEKTK
jgi:hypothetical protein